MTTVGVCAQCCVFRACVVNAWGGTCCSSRECSDSLSIRTCLMAGGFTCFWHSHTRSSRSEIFHLYSSFLPWFDYLILNLPRCGCSRSSRMSWNLHSHHSGTFSPFSRYAVLTPTVLECSSLFPLKCSHAHCSKSFSPIHSVLKYSHLHSSRIFLCTLF